MGWHIDDVSLIRFINNNVIMTIDDIDDYKWWFLYLCIFT